jgi:phosphatidylglycerophosphate synthase
LRTGVLAAAAAGLAIAVLGGAMAAPWLGLSRLFALKANAVFLVAFAVAAGRVRQHHPFPRFGAANLLTAARLALVALLAATPGELYTPALAWAATALAIAVTALDGVDGWLARRAGLQSAFGARFDMETDALLIMVLALIAWRWDRAGAWVLACGLMRYVFVAAGWIWRWLEAPLPPSLRRKTVCVVQIVTLAVIAAPVIPHWLSVSAAAVTLVLLAWSFLVDVVWLARHRVGA